MTKNAGVPPRVPGRPSVVKIEVRLTPEEKAGADALRMPGESMSALVRRLLDREAEEVRKRRPKGRGRAAKAAPARESDDYAAPWTYDYTTERRMRSDSMADVIRSSMGNGGQEKAKTGRRKARLHAQSEGETNGIDERAGNGDL